MGCKVCEKHSTFNIKHMRTLLGMKQFKHLILEPRCRMINRAEDAATGPILRQIWQFHGMDSGGMILHTIMLLRTVFYLFLFSLYIKP